MGRDLHIFGKKKLGLCALVLTSCAAQAEQMPLPSGLVAQQHELVLEPQGAPTQLIKTVRVRFVAEQIADTNMWGFDRVEQDFESLCASVGLKLRAISAPNAERVVISIASEPTNFGDSVPNVVQYFDSFLVQNDTCIWEGL